MENVNIVKLQFQGYGNNGGKNMKTKPINRRDFLKYLGGLAATPLLLRLQNLLKINKQKNPLKEAKYYKSGDHLAG